MRPFYPATCARCPSDRDRRTPHRPRSPQHAPAPQPHHRQVVCPPLHRRRSRLVRVHRVKHGSATAGEEGVEEGEGAAGGGPLDCEALHHGPPGGCVHVRGQEHGVSPETARHGVSARLLAPATQQERLQLRRVAVRLRLGLCRRRRSDASSPPLPSRTPSDSHSKCSSAHNSPRGVAVIREWARVLVQALKRGEVRRGDQRRQSKRRVGKPRLEAASARRVLRRRISWGVQIGRGAREAVVLHGGVLGDWGRVAQPCDTVTVGGAVGHRGRMAESGGRQSVRWLVAMRRFGR
eukprot:scaffold16302_cov136-Isochrysis_galbana.AAC.7